ncbi:MAG TPA: hypothetical protein VJ577_05865, partial [Burkholderiaceae bacterium]|nr:hypothetical protein [Burkholderiaceae bacterium]
TYVSWANVFWNARNRNKTVRRALCKTKDRLAIITTCIDTTQNYFHQTKDLHIKKGCISATLCAIQTNAFLGKPLFDKCHYREISKRQYDGHTCFSE